jgi:hypothetical protein
MQTNRGTPAGDPGNGEQLTVSRQLILVDLESSGLDVQIHQAVEVAWWNLTTGQRGEFIPYHDVREVLANADLRALQINRYIDRIAMAPQDGGGVEARRLAKQLDGNTLVSVNPGNIDGPFLAKMFRMYEDREAFGAPEWHYRMWDINAYAAGVLGLDELPGLEKLCGLLGTTFGPDHTAHGDVTAAGHCFVELQNLAKARAFQLATAHHV